MRIDTDAWRQDGGHGDDIGKPDASLTGEWMCQMPPSQMPPASEVTAPETATDRWPSAEMPEAEFRDGVIALIPALRIHASARARTPNEADDLVQETLVRAWRYRQSFHEGTNLRAWLYKIMQNCLYQSLSKQRDTIEDIEGRWAARQSVAPAQEWHIHYSDMLSALDRLPPEARSALVLIGASGWSYEEAARLANCPVGTLKSRVNRAREKLAHLIDNGHARLGHSRLSDTSLASEKPATARPFREQACQAGLHGLKD